MTFDQYKPVIRAGFKAVLLAGGYCAAGRIVMLSAIIPACSTIIWPSAGIALAGLLVFGWRYWPAIVLGSLLTNFELAPASEGLMGYAFPLVIGLGAAGQALCGRWLILRFGQFPHQPDRYSDLAKLVLLGGPLPCLLNAVSGPLCLLVSGHENLGTLPASMGTWWLGDVLGILLVLPPVSAWCTELHDAPLRTKAAVAVPPIAALLATVCLYVAVHLHHRHSLEENFQVRSSELAKAVGRELRNQVHTLQTLRSFFNSSNDVTREEFDAFALPQIQHAGAIQAIGWVPRVPGTERAAHEDSVRRDGFPSYRITEWRPDSPPVPAGERAEYFPVCYVTPLAGNEPALGFDLASNPVRLDALNRARDGAVTSVTAPITSVQGTDSKAGFLLFVPVYASGTPPETVAARRAELTGFTLGVFRAGETVHSAFNAYSKEDDLGYKLFDKEAPEDGQILALDFPLAQDSSDGAAGLETETGYSGFAVDYDIEVADRIWTLHVLARLDFFTTRVSHEADILLFGGLLVTGLLGGVLLVLAARNTTTERLVAVRTAALQKEIEQRKRIQSEREKLIQELEQAVNEIQSLEGMLPICASCKKIRSDDGYWTQIETYLSAHSNAQFSHGICPDCVQKLYPELDLGYEASGT